MIYTNGQLIDDSHGYIPLTYPEFERFMKNKIREYLIEFHQNDPDKALKLFTPSISKTAKEIDEQVELVVDPSTKFSEPITPAELREELLSSIEELGININRDLPTDQLQAGLKKCLESLSDPERLAIGVYGKPFTQKNIEFWTELKVDIIYLDVVEMILNKEKAKLKVDTPRGSIAAKIILDSLKK